MAHNANTPAPADASADKAALRRSILARRTQVSASDARLAGQAIAAHLSGLVRWREAREVLVYFAIQGEVDAYALIAGLWERGARVLAPRCCPGGTLDLARVTCLSELKPGTLGILEPRPDCCRPPDAFAPDAALIPAVAFDRAGNRLGFGQGYYDRLLAGPAFANTLLVGLAHDFQIVDALPRDPWDRPVDMVVTPSGRVPRP